MARPRGDRRGGYLPLGYRVAAINAVVLVATVVVTILVLSPHKLSTVRDRRGDHAGTGAGADHRPQRGPAAPSGRAAAAVDGARAPGRPLASRRSDARCRADIRGRRAGAHVQRDAGAAGGRAARGDRPRARRAGGRAPADRAGAARPDRPGADRGAAGAGPRAGTRRRRAQGRRRGRPGRGPLQPRGRPADRAGAATGGARRPRAALGAGGAVRALRPALGPGRRSSGSPNRCRRCPRVRARRSTGSRRRR